MKKTQTILIADKNPRISSYLARELHSTMVKIDTVRTAADLINRIYSGSQVDLLILDPELSGSEAIELAQTILDRIPPVPVIVHCDLPLEELGTFTDQFVLCLEKNARSIDTIKASIQRILNPKV